MAAAEARRTSDLALRSISAVVMVIVAGLAFWLGGLVWIGFVAIVSLGVVREWIGLVHGFADTPMRRGLWNGGGLIYVGIAALVLVAWRQDIDRAGELLALMAAVVLTDVFAYGFGRAIGGPKIAPRLSPKKTWAGLLGGMFGASLAMIAAAYHTYQLGLENVLVLSQAEHKPQLALASPIFDWPGAIVIGAGVAVVAQAGDFFESWMKRRAGVKDSGNSLPGHGGLFDRVDGLIAVLVVVGVLHFMQSVL